MRVTDIHLVCPFCLVEGDKVSNFEDAEPGPGALSLCLKCGEFSVFGDRNGLRKPKPFEADHIQQDPECQSFKAAWRVIAKRMDSDDRIN